MILLDEPFSNLDASLRDRVRREVRSILVEARTTSVFVTHDQEEALAMSDTVAVMRSAGRPGPARRPMSTFALPSPGLPRFWVTPTFPGVASDGMVETPSGISPPSTRGRCR